MLDQIKQGSKVWLTANLEIPFGRGINFQIKTSHIAALYEKVQLNNATIFLPMEKKWYRAGDMELCQSQFIILDPDGYMLRFVEFIDERRGSVSK